MIPLLFFKPTEGSFSEWKPKPSQCSARPAPSPVFSPVCCSLTFPQTCGSELLGALALLFPQGATWLAPPGRCLGIPLTVGLLWTSEKTCWRQPASSSLLPHLLWFFSHCIYHHVLHLHYIYIICIIYYTLCMCMCINCLLPVSFYGNISFMKARTYFFLRS